MSKRTSEYYQIERMAIIILLVLFISVSPVQADKHAGAWQFKSLRSRLIKDGYHPQMIHSLYQQSQVSFETRSVSLFFVHSEAKLDYDQFTNPWSINQARKYMQKHHTALVKTEKDYGVDKKIITAIILVETGLGTILGDNRILNTLSSLASLRDRTVREAFWKKFENKDNISRQNFEKRAIRKSGWAYRELKAFLEYTGREKFDPTNIRGSYAGALGISQFMPTTLMAYARDGNQDGTIDLFNHTDAMASIACFLKRFGWRPGISNEKAKKIIYRYNHSDYYVNTIIKISNLLS